MPADQQFTHNNPVGSIGEPNEDPVEVFHLSTLARGRFLTLQKIKLGYTNIDEIWVGVLMVGE